MTGQKAPDFAEFLALFRPIRFEAPFHKSFAPDRQSVGEITYAAANQLPERQFPVAFE